MFTDNDKLKTIATVLAIAAGGGGITSYGVSQLAPGQHPATAERVQALSDRIDKLENLVDMANFELSDRLHDIAVEGAKK